MRRLKAQAIGGATDGEREDDAHGPDRIGRVLPAVARGVGTLPAATAAVGA